MYHVFETEVFSRWLQSLKDQVTKARLLKRLRRVSLGNLGDVKSVGDGVFEMREFFGPGWRMYYFHREFSCWVVAPNPHRVVIYKKPSH